jgi:hypothetical protein
MAADSEFREKVLGTYQMSPIAGSRPNSLPSSRTKPRCGMWKAIIEQAKSQID